MLYKNKLASSVVIRILMVPVVPPLSKGPRGYPNVFRRVDGGVIWTIAIGMCEAVNGPCCV